MKYVYGKNHWRTMAQGLENCFLLTNGLGGFCSLTLSGANARGDHALLMAARTAPNDRVHLVTNVHERITVGDQVFVLACQPFVSHAKDLCGHEYLGHFTYDGLPRWHYQAGGVSVEKTLVMVHGQNTVGVFYEVRNQTRGPVTMNVTPLLRMTGKDVRADRGQVFSWEPPAEAGAGAEAQDAMNTKGVHGGAGAAAADAGTGAHGAAIATVADARAGTQGAAIAVVTSADTGLAGGLNVGQNGFGGPGTVSGIHFNDLALYFGTNGSVCRETQRVTDELYFPQDARDGRDACGICFTDHHIEFTIPECVGRFYIIYSMDGPAVIEDAMKNPWELISRELARQSALEQRCGLKTPAVVTLAAKADAYLVRRDSTGEQSIIAGYPFFGDWGRDTMIALPGLTLSAGRPEAARSILRSFMGYCHKGLMPNLFPEGESEPLYNTADASLLFINAVYLYFMKTHDVEFLREAWPVMEDIILWYIRGTDYNIHMDEDHLLCAGEGLWQVTWMDVRFEEILPTPRHGKPVEINAYWYNALRIMDVLAAGDSCMDVLTAGDSSKISEHSGADSGQTSGDDGRMPGNGSRTSRDQTFLAALDYGGMADHVRDSFISKFWNEPAGCLKDVLSGTEAAAADVQIRCNQIWSLSLPFTMVDEDKARRILDTLYCHLYTPWGLRTLSPADAQFCASYGGTQFSRDMAYHQGTVWAFPLGAFYRAWIRFADDKTAAARWVLTQLEAMEAAMGEGCVGHIGEIYDGLCPDTSRGCFAQAWSVGEILTAYEYAEEILQ